MLTGTDCMGGTVWGPRAVRLEGDLARGNQGCFPQVEGLSLNFQFVPYNDIFEETDISFFGHCRGFVETDQERGFPTSDAATRCDSTISTRSGGRGLCVGLGRRQGFQHKEPQAPYLRPSTSTDPDVILAHSPAARHLSLQPSGCRGRQPSAGESQICHLWLPNRQSFRDPHLTNGRVQPLGVKFWHHLYNIHDDGFTAQIRMLDAANFRQTDTPFDDEGVADHAAESYFRHRATVENVWRTIGAEAVGARTFGSAPTLKARKAVPRDRKNQKALLVGINDYPDPAQRLEGCINDVFTMSAVLQDCGVPSEAIRTCLDGRATADGILSRLKWLLDDPKPGDELVFYYSGHGARIPEYGEDYEPDHFVESLVPWDFDWSPKKTYRTIKFSASTAAFLDCRL